MIVPSAQQDRSFTPTPFPVRGSPQLELRAILDAQLRWEHYRASRLHLVHAMAAGGFFAWILLAAGTPLSEPVRMLIVPAWGLCVLATAHAFAMEWRWFRRRQRRVDDLRRAVC